MGQVISIIKGLNWAFAIAISLFSLFFITYSIKEKEWRAAAFALIFMGGPSFSWIAILWWLKPHDLIIYILFLVLVLFSFLLLISPLGSKKTLEIVAPQEKVDERDVIFTRYYAFDFGSPIYEEYYKRKPHLKKVDDKTRNLPGLGSPKTPTYHKLGVPLLFNYDNFIKKISSLVDGPIADTKKEINPVEMATTIKGILKHKGADIVGITKLNQAYVYSIAGRIAERYGQKIDLNHPYAIVFALEMDFWMVRAAPFLYTSLETNKQYLRAAWIGIALAQYIRSLGYSARAHIDGNYQAILPPIAADAGLGELGRMGILITKKFGPRIRLGLVTTDLPLITDKPVTFGVQDFCERCKKCAVNCPSKAIPKGDKSVEKGVKKWVLNRERCFQYWNSIGTDCAVCVRVCPYSKPNNLLHNIIRYTNEQSFIARQISVLGDDLFYGRKPSPKDYIHWLKSEKKKNF